MAVYGATIMTTNSTGRTRNSTVTPSSEVTPSATEDPVETAFAALPFRVTARHPIPCSNPDKRARAARRLRELADAYRYVTSEGRVPWTMFIALSHAVDLREFAEYVGATLAWHCIGRDRAADLLRVIEAEYERLGEADANAGPMCAAAPSASCQSCDGPGGGSQSAKGQASMDLLLSEVFGLASEEMRAKVADLKDAGEHPGLERSEPPT